MTADTASYSIVFEPLGKREACSAQTSLMDCARRAGIGLISICGGHGTCKACKVQVIQGQVSPPTNTETEFFSPSQIKQGWRLACQTYPRSDCTIHLPVESLTTTQRTQTECSGVTVPLDPAVKSYAVQLAAPDLTDLRSDATRLIQGLEKQDVRCDCLDFAVLKDFSSKLRDWKWEARVSVKGREIMAVSQLSTRTLGLAVDLGTTKIAAYLVDLATGKTIGARGAINPQVNYGEDITSRITNALKSEEAFAGLQESVVDAIDRLAEELCQLTQTNRSEIIDSVIVGNTAMHHLLLKLPVKPLAFSPFVAVVQDSLDIKARDIGLHFAPGACLHILPNVAGFVGADHISMLVAIKADEIKETTLAIDIGTNTEVSLIHQGNIRAASCASGPAFEGAHIKHGMRAASGAIERLSIVNGLISYQTIENAPPVGICGSGIIDALSQLYLAGMVLNNGRIVADSAFAKKTDKQLEIVLAPGQAQNPDVTLTQNDIREIQLAKGAIRAGIQVLMESSGCTEEEIQHVIIAGAFGTYIDVASALNIGMFPVLPLESFSQVGNAAGLGAQISLLSLSQRHKAQEIASKVKYIELATAPNFMQTFMQAGYLGRFRLEKGKRTDIDTRT
jgi:uncharacterized 2Fe-2S/4Fe-4S cluster protein (DUF4445 family)